MFGFFIAFVYSLFLIFAGMNWQDAIITPAKFLFYWNLIFSSLFVMFILTLFGGALALFLKLPLLASLLTPFADRIKTFGFRLFFSRTTLLWFFALSGILSGSYIIAYQPFVAKPYAPEIGLGVLAVGLFARRTHRKTLTHGSGFFGFSQNNDPKDFSQEEKDVTPRDRSLYLQEDVLKMFWYEQSIHPPDSPEDAHDAIAVRNVEWCQGLILGWKLTNVIFPSRHWEDRNYLCPTLVITGSQNALPNPLHSLVSFAFYDGEGRMLCAQTGENETEKGDVISLPFLWARYPFTASWIHSFQVNIVLSPLRPAVLGNLPLLLGDDSPSKPVSRTNGPKRNSLEGRNWYHLKEEFSSNNDISEVESLDKHSFGEICPVRISLVFSQSGEAKTVKMEIHPLRKPKEPVYFLAFFAFYDREGKLRGSGNREGRISEEGIVESTEVSFGILPSLLDGDLTGLEISYFESGEPNL